MKTLSKYLQEAKQDYKVYHKSYREAVEEILEFAESKGYTLDEDDIWNHITTGFGKPSNSETNKIHLPIFKNGKEQKKQLHAQVYNMGNAFELNIYIQ